MANDYRELAEKCRSLARRMTDRRTVEVLLKLAEEYDEKADAAGEPRPPVPPIPRLE